MSVTYSINNDSSLESTRKVDINSVLQSLPNNTQKQIRPRDVRDGFLSTWSNSAFKITSPKNSNLEYIGLDSGNPENRDIKNKILIGKRNFGNNDVMNNQLLNSNTDIFFYNTKNDTQNQSSTKIGIISGTNSEINEFPYLEVIATASQFDFNIVNPSGGDISIKSTTGNVFFNDIPFPKLTETPNNGDLLKYVGTYPLGKLEWSQSDVDITTKIGSPGQETNILGSDVFLNGYSLEFKNNSLVPVSIGGIDQGSSFPPGSFQGQNWPLSEVLRELIYPYIPPKLELSVFNQDTGFSFGDIGFSSSVSITYSITTFAREASEDLFDIEITKIPSDVILNIGTFSANPGSITFSNIQNISVSPPSDIIFEIKSKNIIENSTLETTATASFIFVRPFMMLSIPDGDPNNISDSDVVNGGPSTGDQLNNYLIPQGPDNRFSKTILPYINTSTNIDISITPDNSLNFLYFLYPFDYPELVGIKNIKSGFTLYPQSFTYSNIPADIGFNGYGEYRIYKLLNPQLIVSGFDEFQFLFSSSDSKLINDNWRLSSQNLGLPPLPNMLPNGEGFVFPENNIFDNTTSLIQLSYKSFNNNYDYEGVLREFLPGSIIKISFGDRYINYVVTGTDYLNPQSPYFINIGVSYILPNKYQSLLSGTDDIIQFELLTL
jgi:hypothetical protein